MRGTDDQSSRNRVGCMLMLGFSAMETKFNKKNASYFLEREDISEAFKNDLRSLLSELNLSEQNALLLDTSYAFYSKSDLRQQLISNCNV